MCLYGKVMNVLNGPILSSLELLCIEDHFGGDVKTSVHKLRSLERVMMCLVLEVGKLKSYRLR